MESFNPKGEILQGGIGYYVLCKDCNSFLGKNYVRSYENWVKSGYEVLSHEASDYYKFIALNQTPLKILKQIISMFIVMNDDWFLEEYPELVQFVNNQSSNLLPDKFKVFLYLNNEGQFRYCRHSTISTPEHGILNCSELTFAPFGYVMTFKYDGEIPSMLNITDFKNLKPETTGSISLGLHRFPTFLPFPALDYRSKEEIEAGIKANNAIHDRINNPYSAKS